MISKSTTQLMRSCGEGNRNQNEQEVLEGAKIEARKQACSIAQVAKRIKHPSPKGKIKGSTPFLGTLSEYAS